MCMGRERISLAPGFRKFKLEVLGTGILGTVCGKGGQSTLFTYSSSSDTDIPISRKARPRSSRFGSDRPTMGGRKGYGSEL